MSRAFYRFLYAMRFKPWEQDAENLAPQLRTLLDREVEARAQSPLGTALDLGCGTGRWSIEMASRGWDVTGVDLVPKAVAGARQRAQAAGAAHMRFVEGDVTALPDTRVGTGFGFFLDVECFNHLTDEQRGSTGNAVNAVAAVTQRCSCSYGAARAAGHSLPEQAATTSSTRSKVGV